MEPLQYPWPCSHLENIYLVWWILVVLWVLYLVQTHANHVWCRGSSNVGSWHYDLSQDETLSFPYLSFYWSPRIPSMQSIWSQHHNLVPSVFLILVHRSTSPSQPDGQIVFDYVASHTQSGNCSCVWMRGRCSLCVQDSKHSFWYAYQWGWWP